MMVEHLSTCQNVGPCTCGATDRAIELARQDGATTPGVAWAWAFTVLVICLTLLTCTAGKGGWAPWQ